MPQVKGRRRAVKALKKLVAQGDLAELVAWCRSRSDGAALLLPRAFDVDDERRWLATVGLGKVTGAMAAEGDLEAVRGIVRRVLWLMNDESGGIGWNGPEIIAQILLGVPQLMVEYAGIVASFHNQEPFGPGAFYAMAKLAPRAPSELIHMVDVLTDGLASKDPFVRAHALLALSALRPRSARKRAKLLVDDGSELLVFGDDATIGTTTVSEVARSVIGEGKGALAEAAAV